MTESATAKAWAMPPALVILSGVLLLAAVACMVVPRGSFEREQRFFPTLHTVTVTSAEASPADLAQANGLPNDQAWTAIDSQTREPIQDLSAYTGQQVLLSGTDGWNRTVVVPGSYERLSSEEQSSLSELPTIGGRILLAPILGIQDKAQIIGFVLLIGGGFGIMLGTGAIDRGLRDAVLGLEAARLRLLVIPVSFGLFSLGGSVFGLGESTIAFVLITIPLAIRLGYDTVTGVAMCYFASQIGFASAFMNPFTLGIGQSIAELPYLSGFGLRVTIWFMMTGLGIAFVLWHAERVRRDPSRSPTPLLDQQRREKAQTDQSYHGELTTRDGLVLMVTLGSMVGAAWGVSSWGWYINEMAALFVGCGVLAGIFAGLSPKAMAQRFIDGSAMMVEACLIIALSAGVVIVLQQGQVLDTILQALANPLETLPGWLAPVVVMLVQAVVNFFVPSGSGQAAMTMPIVAPLCDLIGVERQIGVLSFQFGDGLSNTLIPTSAVLMGVLGAARVDWAVWVRWVLPFVIGLHIVAAIILILVTQGPTSWLT
ncbi:YfcC family protein [Mucisphaera sp.]|uniref:YfcC family protein n=1 Tax=Mucisphaera sp. TaxID=2913024 RepID=UPI003D10082C